MKGTRLIIRCNAQPDKHAKKLEMHGMTRKMIEDFAGLLCGTSRFYIHKPGPESPIGKCATCGAQLSWEIEAMEGKDAESDK